MKVILNGLYREPVLFNGVIVALAAGLSAAEVVPVWIGATVAGIGAVITRRYTSPASVANPTKTLGRRGVGQ